MWKTLIKETVQLDGHTWHLQGIQHAFACKPNGICQDVMEGRVWSIFLEYDDVGDVGDDDDDDDDDDDHDVVDDDDHDDDNEDDDDVDDDAQLTYQPNGYVSQKKRVKGLYTIVILSLLKPHLVC